MNKKIYKGYELVKAIEDEEIKEGTILIFTSTIAKDNKKEVEVVRRPEGLILYKKDTAEILPTSWLFNSKIEVLEDNTEEINIQEIEEINEYLYYQGSDLPNVKDGHCVKTNELIRAIKQLDRVVNKLRKENK